MAKLCSDRLVSPTGDGDAGAAGGRETGPRARQRPKTLHLLDADEGGFAVAVARCRPCSAERIPKRQPNAATHFTVYVDGLTTLTCSRHATMACRGGGFAIALGSFLEVLTAELDSAQLHDALRAANRSING